MKRRQFINGSVAGGISASFPFIVAGPAKAYVNEPKGGTVTIGFNVPQTGAYADESADELRAYKLAIKHLNGIGDGGMMNTMKPMSLKGNGILGKKVQYVTGDTRIRSDAARASAKRMIEKEGAIMITGGSSSGVAVAVQSLCQEAGIIFMAGLAVSNDVTGKDKRKHGFRHFLNCQMIGAALAPILEKELGKDRTAYHLTADYTWGWSCEGSIRRYTEERGWNTSGAARTRLGAGDFSRYIGQVLNSGADVLVLNHYGRDMINSLTQVVQFGLRDKSVNGKDFQIVVPLFSRLMAQGVGRNIRGVLGCANWNWSLKDAGSQAFVKSFGAEYGFSPSQAAHTCYVQTLLYANACEMAGTFNPCGVIEALEGFRFDGFGNGPTEYRADDHQCFKDVLVVRGKQNPSSQFDLLEVVDITPRSQVEYPSSLLGGNLGSCNA